MGIREEQKEKRRNEILAKALELFSMQGYGETKVTDIAKAANMSTGLLFHYFESKEVLYAELLKMGMEIIEKRSANLIKEPLDYFECAVTTIINLIKENIQIAQMIILIEKAMKSKVTPNELKEYITNVAFNIFKINENKIILGQQQGVIKEGNPKALLIILVATLYGIAELYLMDSNLEFPEVSWIIDIIKKH